MRVLRSRNYTRMPWKNGGGETMEMLVSPDGALLNAFDWRISMAHVATSGPFSLFPDVDRTLSVIAGAGFTLAFDDRTVLLDRASEPFRFAGDVRVESGLADGAIDDLNVMTRRGCCDHRVTRHALVGPTRLTWADSIGIVVAIGGFVDVRMGAETATLAPKDAVIFATDDARDLIATPHGDADMFVIEIWDL